MESKTIGATDNSRENVQRSGTSDKVGNLACKLSELRDLYELKLEELYIQRTRIERFINNIGDAEIRCIVRYRSVSLKTWEEIGDKLGYDRRTVSRKYYNYINNGKIAHNAHLT